MKKTLFPFLFLCFTVYINAQRTANGLFVTKDTVIGKAFDGNDIVAITRTETGKQERNLVQE